MELLIKNCMLLDGVNFKTPTLGNIVVKGNSIAKIDTTNTVGSNQKFDSIIDINGKLLTPGLMDLHVHSSDGFALIGCTPDKIGMEIGTTTIFDAGTYGADTFDYFYENLITKATTRTYAWLNVASCGLTTLSELKDMNNINEEKIINAVKKYPKIIVGLKVRASGSVVGENGINPVLKAKEIANKLNFPLMVHIGNPPPYVDDVLNMLTKGDIVTHCYHNKQQSLYEEAIIRETALEAKKRGVLFDVGHGIASFSFEVAKKMIAKGFTPDFISTDIYDKNIEKPVKSQLSVISKLVLCGLDLGECVAKTTSQIAKTFNLQQIGEIKETFVADFSIIKILEKNSLLEDSVGIIENSKINLENDGVFINGRYYPKKIN